MVVAAREPTRLQYVADDCCQAAARQGAAMAVPTDVTVEHQVRNLVNTAVARFETVDVVINCAGAAARGLCEDTPLAEARKLMGASMRARRAAPRRAARRLSSRARRTNRLCAPSLRHGPA